MDEDSRPETSPYAVPSVALNFGGGCTLYISPHLLAQSHKLEALYLDNPLYFLNVSHDAGHVLVHYLITGTYQSLKPGYLLPYDNIAAEFSTGVHVYTAAKTFVLPSLVELAKAEIERLGERLQLSLVFNLLQMAYPAPDADDIWISNYLKNRVKTFLRDGLMDQLVGEAAATDKTVPISHILFKGMLELLQENTISLREEINDTVEEATGHLSTFQRAPRCLVDKPVVESNQKTGEPDRSLNDIDDPWGYPSKIKKPSKVTNAAPGLQEKKDSEDISTQDIAANQDMKNEKDLGSEAEDWAAWLAAEAAEAAAIAEEEAEIAQLIDKRDNSFLGLNKRNEKRLCILQAKAKRRAEEQATCEAEEQAAREAAAAAAAAAAREAERAAKEDKGKGKRGKKNNNNNLIVIDPLPEQPEGYLVVKAQQEIRHDENKENKDESRALHGQKPSKGGEKKKNSEANAPIVHSSDGDLAGDPWQETKPDEEKEEGWSFWGLGKNKKGLENEDWAISPPPPPPCNTGETEI